MPKLLNPSLYKAIYGAALKFFQTPSPLRDRLVCEMKPGTPHYRYVGYRNFKPQEEAAGRRVWSPLDKDVDNRWTGSDLAGGGRQGLYLSHERPGAELRTMFLFSLTKRLAGLDLTNPQDGALAAIHAAAARVDPDALDQRPAVESLYVDPNDASFTRAVGNAALVAGYQYFKTTSVRDRSSVNVVIVAEWGKPVDSLRPEGRATFLVDPVTQKTKGVVTIDDMKYNAHFDARGGA